MRSRIPNSRSYAAFVQNTFQMTRNFTLNARLALRLANLSSRATLQSNPLYTPSGKVPTDLNNFSPRVGFAYSLGERHSAGDSRRRRPLLHADSVDVCLAGSERQWSAANATVSRPDESGAGGAVSQLSDAAGELSAGTLVCTPPTSLAPYADHADLRLLAEFPDALHRAGEPDRSARAGPQRGRHRRATPTFTASTRFVRSTGTCPSRSSPNIRSTTTPDRSSWACMTWRRSQPGRPHRRLPVRIRRASIRCSGPIRGLGAINSFESESSSIYNGMTISLKRQMNHGMYFQVGYTLAKAMDDGPDALVVGRPGNVQNSYATSLEWGPSVTDQRNRFVAAWVAEPKFQFDQGTLEQAGQQLEAVQCFDRRLGHGRSMPPWRAIRTATATSITIGCPDTSEMHLSAPTTSAPTCASPAAFGAANAWCGI